MVPSDINIAKAAKIKPIYEIASQMGIAEENLEYFGRYKAKLPLHLIDEEKVKKSRLILVTAITPTPAGEGKTTTSIGLAQAMNVLGHKTTVVLREPSLGPVFGVKGGAAGGGYSQVIPMEDINLHFTGDIAAVEKANNLLAALIDNQLQNKGKPFDLDPRTISWRRVMDMNDRSLRDIVIGLGGRTQGVPRQDVFNITAASEVMAILCLSKDIEDLKQRLGNIFVGYTYDKQAIYARDLNAQGAMATLLKDAIKPNLVQTLENTPAIIHGGPFANIAQGTNSVVATKLGLTFSDFVVTEAGFASDLGAEKFFDIKMRSCGLHPNAVVIVATVRALKYHGNQAIAELSTPNVEALRIGLANLDKHIENMKAFHFNPIVAINRFASDSEEELKLIESHCSKMGVKVALNEAWAKGGKGALSLAEMVVEEAKKHNKELSYLYDTELPVEEKIEIIARKMYGATKVEYTAKARTQLKTVSDLQLDKLPICIAKTQNSLSDNPKVRNRPENFAITIRDIEIASGAGFIIPIAGEIIRMPGLPKVPSAEVIDIDKEGNITGLF